MTKEQEQKEADQNLREAIIQHAIAYDMADGDTDLLQDYAIVSHWASRYTPGIFHYNTHYSRPSMPYHISIGLFYTGISCIEEADV